jgi:hypothetical protein
VSDLANLATAYVAQLAVFEQADDAMKRAGDDATAAHLRLSELKEQLRGLLSNGRTRRLLYVDGRRHLLVYQTGGRYGPYTEVDVVEVEA